MMELPNQVGRYRIDAVVGRGAAGTVCRAEDPTIHRTVALKLIPAGDGGFGKFFDREARAAGALLDSHIIALYDAGTEGDWHYLAMEYVEGDTLAARLKREKTLSPEDLVEIGAAVANALHIAHERGIIHRDVKPANLMFDGAGRVKVADFGIARLVAQAATTMTANQIAGTPVYMSPEQVRGETLDGRTDLYSLGIVLYEAATGMRPFKGKDVVSTFHAVLNEPIRPAHEVAPSVPRVLSDVIARATSRDPAARFANGKEMAAALRRSIAVADAPPARRSRRSLLAAAVGVTVAFVTLGVFAATRGDLPTPLQEPTSSGWVDFRSDPSDVEIVVGGAILGRTPFTAELAAGSHEIEYRKPGYYPASATIDVDEAKRVEIDLELMPQEDLE